MIAASGMATGGRVLHHLDAALPDPKNTVLFVGYQAAGTRGRSLVDGAKTVRMQGQMVPVGARIETTRFDVGACRCRRDHAVAVRVLAAAGDDLSRPRRSRSPSTRSARRIAGRARWPVHVAQHQEKVELIEIRLMS